jgi:hypothetical protein
MHKITFTFFLLIFVSVSTTGFAQNAVSQNNILKDSVSNPNSNLHNITISKNPVLPWSNMNIFQKAMVFIKMFFNRYGITAWVLFGLLILWMLKFIFKLLKK